MLDVVLVVYFMRIFDGYLEKNRIPMLDMESCKVIQEKLQTHRPDNLYVCLYSKDKKSPSSSGVPID